MTAQELVKRGSELAQQEQLNEAADCFQEALRLEPDKSHVLAAYGKVRQIQRRFAEAADAYNQALEIDPANPWLHCYKGSLLLLLGSFEEAWRELEWYWATPISLHWARQYQRPRWDGSSIADRTILLLAPKGGFGDNLMWARYVPHVVEMAKSVVIRCPVEMVRLFAQLTGVSQVVSFEQQLPEYDVYAPLMSLAHLLHKPNPGEVESPYLRPDSADMARWQVSLPERSGPRVGLAWAIDPTHAASKSRSLPSEALLPLADVPGVTLVSLQRGLDVGSTALGESLIDLGPGLRDFADTAALLTQLDLVICADTAVAHLAGALDRPLWLLLARNAEARWLLNRRDTPWYPSARLFRQPEARNWQAVIDEVCHELAAFGRERLNANRAKDLPVPHA